MDGQTNWCDSQPFEWIDVAIRTDDQSAWKDSQPVETVFVPQAPPVQGGQDDIFFNTL